MHDYFGRQREVINILSMAPPLHFAALRSFVAGAGLLLPAFALRRPLPRGRGVGLGLLSVGLSATRLGLAACS